MFKPTRHNRNLSPALALSQLFEPLYIHLLRKHVMEYTVQIYFGSTKMVEFSHMCVLLDILYHIKSNIILCRKFYTLSRNSINGS